MKKILAIVLSLCLAFSMLPFAAVAAEPEEPITHSHNHSHALADGDDVQADGAKAALTGVGIEFDESIAPVAEDWTLAGSNSSIGTSIYLDNGNANSYINGTYNDTFNLTNGFTVTYKAKGRYYNNYAVNNAYLSVVIGNVSAGLEVADAAKSAVVLKIRVNNTVVATSDIIFDANSEGWDASKANAANVGNFLGGLTKVLTLDYDVETKTVTYSTPEVSVSYVDEENAIDVSDAAVVLRTHASWAGFATFSEFKLEGKKPSLTGTTITFNDVELTSLTAADWTKTKGSFKTANYGTYVKGADSTDAQVTTTNAYDLSKDFVLNVGYGKINYNTKSGYNFTIKIGGVDIKIEPATFSANFSGATKVTVSVDGTVVGEATGGNYASSCAFKTAVGSDVTADRFITALVTYKDGVLKVTISGVVVFEGAITTDLSNAKVALIEEKKTGWSSSFIYDFDLKAGSTTITLQEVEDLMASLAGASLETYADAAATIDAVMPLLSADKLELLTSVAVYEKYKADYANYNEYKEADAAIVAKNVTYKLINGMYAEDWTDVSLGGGMFIRGTKAIDETTNVTINPAGFYANDSGHHTMTSKDVLNTADYFKIVQKQSMSDYQDTYFLWTIGDLAIGIYDDGENASPDGNTGYNVDYGDVNMAVFKIFYKGELVKAITGAANDYGLDTTVDGCSTWMLSNCEFTITYDKGNLMITFYNGATKYVTAKTGFDLTAIEGFDYNPNGNKVELDIYTYYSKLKLTKATVTGKMNKAAVDAVEALAATDINAAKNIYETISDTSVLSDENNELLAPDFAISAEEGLAYTAVVDGYNANAYRYGDSVTFTAVDDVCFVFDGWYDAEGNLLSEEKAYTCTINPGVSIIAKLDEEASLKHQNTTETKENEVAADCDTAGSYEKVIICDDCGDELSRETITVDALGHTAGNVVVENEVAGSCTVAHSYDNVVYCTVCGEELSRETITVDALGHTAGNVVIENEVAGSCTVAHSYDKVVYCTVCGEEISRETVTDSVAGEHILGGYVNNGDGTQTRTCPCGEVSETVTNAVGPNITWEIDENGVLTLTGTGATFDYINVGNINPFTAHRFEIKSIVIGDGITHLGNRLFKGVNHTASVTFGKDVETMGYEVFYGFTGLEDIKLNEGLKELGSLTFYNCYNLESIELPSTLETINHRAFKFCTALTEIVIPNSVTYTGYELFMGDTALKSVIFSENCSLINSLAFKDCTALTEFVVPANVTRISFSAFADSGLLDITFVDECNLHNGSNNEPRMASNVFEGCSSDLVMKGFENGYVEYYATAHGRTFNFEAIGVQGIYLSWSGDYMEGIDYNRKGRDVVCTLENAIALHITGSGVNVIVESGLYDGGDNGETMGMLVEHDSNVVVNGGTFRSSGTRGTVVVKSGAVAELKGGFYESDNGQHVISNEGGTIIITGGTYVNYDPTAFVADGYAVTAETQSDGNIWYTVAAN